MFGVWENTKPFNMFQRWKIWYQCMWYQLFRAQVVPWFANIMNYLVTGEMSRVGLRMIGIIFFPWFNSLYGMTLTNLNIIQIKCLEDVSLMSTFRKSCPFVMINLVEGTSVEKFLLRRFSKSDSIGLPYLEMPISIANASIVNKWARKVGKY